MMLVLHNLVYNEHYFCSHPGRTVVSNSLANLKQSAHWQIHTCHAKWSWKFDPSLLDWTMQQVQACLQVHIIIQVGEPRAEGSKSKMLICKEQLAYRNVSALRPGFTCMNDCFPNISTWVMRCSQGFSHKCMREPWAVQCSLNSAMHRASTGNYGACPFAELPCPISATRFVWKNRTFLAPAISQTFTTGAMKSGARTSNITKYWACHDKWHGWLVLVTHETTSHKMRPRTSPTIAPETKMQLPLMQGRFDHDPSRIQPWTRHLPHPPVRAASLSYLGDALSLVVVVLCALHF